MRVYCGYFMKVRSSLRHIKAKECKLIKRGKRLWLIHPKDPKIKIRQGKKAR